MIEKRIIKAKIVTEYNEVKKCLDNNELVFYVVGTAREEVLAEIKKDKKGGRDLKTIGGTWGVAGALTLSMSTVLAPIAMTVGGLVFLTGVFGSEFKKYQITDNVLKGRLEFVRVKGNNHFNEGYDSIVE